MTDPLADTDGRRPTWRLVAAIIGKIHHAILRLVPLGRQTLIPEVIDILRTCAAAARQPDASWDQQAIIRDDQATVMRSAWTTMQANDWYRLSETVLRTLSSDPVYVFSDASTKDALGVVVYTPGVLSRHEAAVVEHPDPPRGAHIYFLELQAALEALRRACRLPKEPLHARVR
jgi:hypothetical protein